MFPSGTKGSGDSGGNLGFWVWQLAQEVASCYVWRWDLGQGAGAGAWGPAVALEVRPTPSEWVGRI